MKPVIFIPGFPASELLDANGNVVFPPSPGTLLDSRRKRDFFARMLDIPGDLVAGQPIRSVLGIAKQAQSLYDILDRFHCPVTPVGWDWRLGIDAVPTMNAVASAIRSVEPQKAVVIVHSTGALVLRAFLAAHPELEKNIEQVLAFGAAWCGTLEALYAVTTGRSQSIFGLKLLTEDESANLISHMQAAYDLFPPDPAQTPMDDVPLVFDAKGNAAGANVDLSWIASDRAYSQPLAQYANLRLGDRDPDFGMLPLTNVAGWGGPTWPRAVLRKGNVTFDAEDKNHGDGTVPYVSTNWIIGANVRTLVVPIGAFVADPIPDVHAHLWDSIAVNQIFHEVLEDAPQKELIAAAADADEAIDYSKDVTVRMVAEAPNGHPLPDCVATANINGRKVNVPFNGGRTAILRVKRAGIKHNAATDVYRFNIDFNWTGGQRKNIAVSFRSV